MSSPYAFPVGPTRFADSRTSIPPPEPRSRTVSPSRVRHSAGVATAEAREDGLVRQALPLGEIVEADTKALLGRAAAADLAVVVRGHALGHRPSGGRVLLRTSSRRSVIVDLLDTIALAAGVTRAPRSSSRRSGTTR